MLDIYLIVAFLPLLPRRQELGRRRGGGGTWPPAATPPSSRRCCGGRGRVRGRGGGGGCEGGRHLPPVEPHEVLLGQDEPLLLGGPHQRVNVRAAVAEGAELEGVRHQPSLLQRVGEGELEVLLELLRGPLRVVGELVLLHAEVRAADGGVLAGQHEELGPRARHHEPHLVLQLRGHLHQPRAVLGEDGEGDAMRGVVELARRAARVRGVVQREVRGAGGGPG